MSEGGPRLSELQKDRFDATKAASDQARTVALAGIAIVWLFAGPFFEGKSTENPSSALFVAGAALVLALALDLAQLVVRAILLDSAYTRLERESTEDDPIIEDIGTNIRTVTRILFILKLAGVGVGYAAILGFFAAKVL